MHRIGNEIVTYPIHVHSVIVLTCYTILSSNSRIKLLFNMVDRQLNVCFMGSDETLVLYARLSPKQMRNQ